MNRYDNIRKLFEQFKNLSFWQRVFSWSAIKALSYDALEEFTILTNHLEELNRQVSARDTNLKFLENQKESLLEKLDTEKERLTELTSRYDRAETELNHLRLELQSKTKLLQEYEGREDQRVREHDQRLTQALSMKESFEKEKQRLSDERVAEVKLQEQKQSETWRNHEKSVESFIKVQCDLHAIEYVTEFSFTGKPDNAVRINNEIIVFDAKSPENSERLANFNSYLKEQAEKAKKYTGKEGVRSDVYLVVPSNTWPVIKKWSYDLGTHRVYIITLDALEPVLLSLKQLEVYHFAEQLSPENRQAIVRIIGRLLYMSKRRIQVDQFFNGHLLELISSVQREIPGEMLEDISKNEKAMKLNPANDRRAKEISTTMLETSHKQLNAIAEGFEAPMPVRIDITNK